jgi:hypothetical protein
MFVCGLKVAADIDYGKNDGVCGQLLERRAFPARAPSYGQHCDFTHGAVLAILVAQAVGPRY